jgi:hypothetical protein
MKLTTAIFLCTSAVLLLALAHMQEAVADTQYQMLGDIIAAEHAKTGVPVSFVVMNSDDAQEHIQTLMKRQSSCTPGAGGEEDNAVKKPINAGAGEENVKPVTNPDDSKKPITAGDTENVPPTAEKKLTSVELNSQYEALKAYPTKQALADFSKKVAGSDLSTAERTQFQSVVDYAGEVEAGTKLFSPESIPEIKLVSDGATVPGGDGSGIHIPIDGPNPVPGGDGHASPRPMMHGL